MKRNQSWVCAGAVLLLSMLLGGAADATVRLRNAVIDTSSASPLARVGAVSAELASFFGQHDASRQILPCIVQFVGPIHAAWKQAVEDTGARLGGYLPENAFIVEMTGAQLELVSALACVHWVGPFKPDYKIDPALAYRLETAMQGGAADVQEDTFTIQTFSFAQIDVVRDAVLAGNGQVLSAVASARRGLIRVRMSVALVAQIISLPEVEFVEVYVAPQVCNNVATDNEHMNVQRLWTNLNLTGVGQIVAVADTGLDTGDLNTIHPDFSNRVVAAFALGRENDWSDSTANKKGGHGTHVAGSVLGSGAAWSNGLFRGAAYEASLVFQSIMDAEGKLGGIPEPLTNLFYQAYTNGARLHNNSWGSSVAGAYDSSSQSADQFVWDMQEMLIMVSAGNEGVDSQRVGVIAPRSVGSPATAKNVLTVGAAESKRPSGTGGYSAYTYFGVWPDDYPVNPIRGDLISTAHDNIHQGMAAFSSRGPCVDGRFKPDIVAPGTDIVSCRSRMPGAEVAWGTGYGVLDNAASNYYVFSGGTSMSSPLTTGAAALMRQYLQEHRGINAPSAALMKAVLVNGARSLSPGQYGVGQYREIPAVRPNNVEGWGQVDLANTFSAADGATNVYYDVTDADDALRTGSSVTYAFVLAKTTPLHVTLCWSDYPATLAAAHQLVNDLDLTVVTPDGVIHYPNGGTRSDWLNNTEGMVVSSAVTGTVLITVSGYNVPNGPQPYALVIRGVGEALPPIPTSFAPTVLAGDFDGDRFADPTVYKADGAWKLKLSSSGYSVVPLARFLGGSGWAALAADFDGDGLADPAVYQAATGDWQIKLSTSGYAAVPLRGFLGGSGWIALAADFDGDRFADPAVYQSSSGDWEIKLSSSGYSVVPLARFLGGSGWAALAADFDGDGLADPAVYQAATGDWQIKLSMSGYAAVPLRGFLGGSGFIALAADFDGDGKADPAVANPANGHWQIKLSGQNYTLVDLPNFLGE